MCDAKGKKTKVLGLEFTVKGLSGGLRLVIVARARNNKATIVSPDIMHVTTWSSRSLSPRTQVKK